MMQPCSQTEASACFAWVTDRGLCWTLLIAEECGLTGQRPTTGRVQLWCHWRWDWRSCWLLHLTNAFFLNNSFTRPSFITRTTPTRARCFLMDSSWTRRMPRWNLHYGIHLALLLSHACLCSAYVTVSYILETLYYLTALMCLLKTLNFTNAGVEHWLWVWCAGKLWNLWRYRKAAPRQHDMSLSFALVLKIDACSHLSWKKDILFSSPFFSCKVSFVH